MKYLNLDEPDINLTAIVDEIAVNQSDAISEAREETSVRDKVAVPNLRAFVNYATLAKSIIPHKVNNSSGIFQR
ncbi:MAG: hypothetical protein Fur0025_46390 [Oscillatoriaceae cyanobacterium]